MHAAEYERIFVELLVTNQRSRIDIMTMAKARYVGGFGQAGSVQLP